MSLVLSDAMRPRLRLAATLPLPVLIAVAAACGAPARRPLTADELTASVEARAASAESLERALTLAVLEPLAIPLPPVDALDDPGGDAFWHACALAFAPSVRAARSDVAAARARAGSAGAPGPIQVGAEVEDLDDPEMHTRVMPTLDLLGVLGLGPAAAARALADAEVRAAHGELEQAVWLARFDVDTARARLAAARAARASLRALAAEAELDRARIEVLEQHGRLDGGSLAAAELARRRLAGLEDALALEEARAAEALAIAAGLPPTSSALAAPDAEMLAALLPAEAPQTRSSTELLARLPALRAALLEYAVAEERLRSAAAARWPGLRLGPHLKWTDDDFLLGALAATGIPWPGSLDGEVEAARVEREAARERVEDELLAARARLEGARARYEAARVLVERDALPAAAESERLWRASRARFSVEPAALEQWAHALRTRAEALSALEEARAALALAALDAAESVGPSLPAETPEPAEVIP